MARVLEQQGHVLAGQTNQNRAVDLVSVHTQPLAYHQRLTEEMRALRAVYFGIAERTAHRSGMPAVEQALEDGPEDLALTAVDCRLHVPLNWLALANSSCSELPRSFVQQAYQFLLEQDMSSSLCFEVSWVELLVMGLLSGRVQFPFRCSVTGVWKERQSLPFASDMTLAAQLSLLWSVWRRSLGTALLEQFLVKGLDRCLMGVQYPLDGLRIGCDQELLLKARQSFSKLGEPACAYSGSACQEVSLLTLVGHGLTLGTASAVPEPSGAV